MPTPSPTPAQAVAVILLGVAAVAVLVRTKPSVLPRRNENGARGVFPNDSVKVFSVRSLTVIQDQLLAVDSLYATRGYTPHGPIDFETVPSQQLVQFTATLSVGTYVMAVACDEQCEDVDLRVTREPGARLLGQDLESDALPIVEFSVVTGDSIQGQVLMDRCGAAACGYGLRVLRKTLPPKVP